MIQRFANSATMLAAAIIDLLVVFDAVNWGEEEIAAVNLVAVLIIGVIFGAQQRSEA